ncbi:MAG TPA: acyl-CoA dehydrogenase family protein [Myxococcota bacterium]|nr:acyl-CoA dehydrogenase family protein [Myxococcota bacterium]
MELGYSAEYEAFRGEVKAFLAASWPLRGDEARLAPDKQASLFRERAIAAGYLARSIPRRYGGSEQSADVLKAQLIREEFARARAPGEMAGIGPSMLVPTLLEKGSEWQKEKFIAPTLRGDIIWCQGYSEPGSGSDLASLQTRAVLVGDEWVINGQKIWTSGAHRADYMFCLCRTEPEAQKHGGISYLLLSMKQPGIEVRPLRQMTGAADFNEVFFTDARTPKDWIVGKRGEGWLVSRTTLKHERNMIGDAANALATFRALVSLAQRTLRDGKRATQDPAIRQRLVQLEGYVRAHQYSGYRQLSKAAKGQDPGRVQLMNKLTSTNIGHEVAKLALDLLGDDGLYEPGDRVLGGPRTNAQWVGQFMWSLGSAVAGGTANIQRNVIGERGLGLPRDEAARGSAR